MKNQKPQFYVFEELKKRAATDTLLRVYLSFFNECSAEQMARVRSVKRAQFNTGILGESALNPNGRQQAQGEGEPSRGDFGIEILHNFGELLKGDKGACEFKIVSVKSSADDARNGTLAPYTLILLFDREKWELRFGKSSEVRTSIKGKRDPKRVIKYRDNLDFGKPISLKDFKTFAL